MFFDSHAHLDYEAFPGTDTEDIIKETEESEVDYVLEAGTDIATSKAASDHAKKYDWCYAAAGYHPHEAKDMGEPELAMIRMLAGEKKVRAIGEIGLDFYYDRSDRDIQRECFRKQIRLANALKKPVVIHSRDADQEVMDILKEEGAFSEERKSWFHERPVPEGWEKAAGDARVMLHCYSGSSEMGRQYVKLGASLSFAGPLTYRNNRKTADVVRSIPMEFIMAETDSPYLAPEPFRGRPNRPSYVRFTVMRIAALKETDLKEAAKITSDNAKRFFAIES